jgi:hypothetical protein
MFMDSSTISLKLARLIGPALPILIAGSEAAAKSFAEEIGKEAWTRVSGCWHVLKGSVEKDAASKAKLEKVAAITNADERIRDLAELIKETLPSAGVGASVQLAKFITNVGYMTDTHIGDKC